MPSIVTVTPLGTATGLLPIRLSRATTFRRTTREAPPRTVELGANARWCWANILLKLRIGAAPLLEPGSAMSSPG